MDQRKITLAADVLFEAERQRREVERISLSHPSINVADAYAVMEALIARKEKIGQKVIGYKLGYTSKAMQQQMGVDDPIYGLLFDYMMMENGEDLVVEQLIHPKLEAEIAFVMKKDLQGPGITREDVLEATDYVTPILEVVDSRYLNYKFKMVDVIADNNSGARVIASRSKFKVGDVNLPEEKVTLKQNGAVVQTGTGADVMGHPADAIVWLANCLSEHGRKIQAGDFIISGGMTSAIDLALHDHIEADFGSLGVVEFKIV
ncbi:4-oxalocrotonate decarboxylase [bacterium LRH843]|nr:4-oxalocrotonate decarboxylase [bacterium LRH843]